MEKLRALVMNGVSGGTTLIVRTRLRARLEPTVNKELDIRRSIVAAAIVSLAGCAPPAAVKSESAGPGLTNAADARTDSIRLAQLPADGFLSSALDLATFGSAVIEGASLSRALPAAMFTPQSTKAGASTVFGFGWRVVKDPSGRRIAVHGGDAVGGRAFVLAYPDDGLVLAMTSNLGLAPFAETEAMLIAELFLPSAR